jgi:hypothetical protein
MSARLMSRTWCPLSSCERLSLLLSLRLRGAAADTGPCRSLGCVFTAAVHAPVGTKARQQAQQCTSTTASPQEGARRPLLHIQGPGCCFLGGCKCKSCHSWARVFAPMPSFATTAVVFALAVAGPVAAFLPAAAPARSAGLFGGDAGQDAVNEVAGYTNRVNMVSEIFLLTRRPVSCVCVAKHLRPLVCATLVHCSHVSSCNAV